MNQQSNIKRSDRLELTVDATENFIILKNYNMSSKIKERKFKKLCKL